MELNGDGAAAPSTSDRVSVVELGAETRVAVFARHEGAYRLLTVAGAPSTLDAPHFDLTPSFERAVAEAESLAGAYFAMPESSARPHGEPRTPPIAAAVGRGLAPGPSCFVVSNLVTRDLDALEEALTGREFVVIGRATTAAREFRDRIDGPATVDVITTQRPSVVVVALTEDRDGQGLSYMADLLIGGLAGRESSYVPVIAILYGDELDDRALTILEQAFPVHAVSVQGGGVDDPLDMTEPNALLDDVQQTVKAHRFAGRTVPAEIADAPAHATAAALGEAVRELATQQALEVAAVSLDDDQVSIVGFQAGSGVSVGLGQGHDLARPYHIALQTPIERVAQWAPEEPIPQALRFTALNRSAHPAAVAATPAELQLTHAVFTAAARQALRASEDGRSPLNHEALDLIVLTGRAARGAGRSVQAALLLVNILEPVGVSQLAIDPTSSLAMQGALARTGARVAFDSTLVPLGVCVAPRGRAKSGEPAVLVDVRPSSGARIEREVSAGALDVIQWDARVPAEVRIWPQPRFDVGLGNGRPARLKANVGSGLVGLIVDARGRPLVWPDEPDERQARLQQWLRSMDAFPPAATAVAPARPHGG
ncbi:MAG: hypothetical protein OXG33_07495 [Chloroflexi bacterium]|nr:hypothetical protein [Chloroflexota bacterium]